MTITAPPEEQKNVEWGFLRCRFATPDDIAVIMTLFEAMLRELEPLGHDVLPTPRNLVTFARDIFGPALMEERHGIVLAMSMDVTPVAASFFVPEQSVLDVPPNRAVAHGIYTVPRWRKDGLAKQLQQMAHRRLSFLGYTKLISYVLKGNEAAWKSASSAGAHIVSYGTCVNLTVETGD